MSTTTERPERSRNAKAQARHRAKRKLYIEQLEQTVTKLQTALGYSPEDIAALPPPLLKIQELEAENARLLKENHELQRMLAESGRLQPLDLSRRGSGLACDRDYGKRRKDDYLTHDVSDRPPPPLTIPHSVPYSSSHPVSSSGHNSLFALHAPAFGGLEHSPSSSTTSSPPFSPAQMSSASPIGQRSPLVHGGLSSAYPTSHTSHHNNYAPVKVEDDHFHHHPSAHHHSNTPTSYSFSNHSTNSDHSIDSGGWHSYSSSSERQLHHAHRP